MELLTENFLCWLGSLSYLMRLFLPMQNSAGPSSADSMAKLTVAMGSPSARQPQAQK